MTAQLVFLYPEYFFFVLFSERSKILLIISSSLFFLGGFVDLREYAILAMKNILTGNSENQALIEELQPIEAVDHPALQEARVSARLDADTGRPVLSQIKK